MTLAWVKMKSSTSWGDGLTDRRSVVSYDRLVFAAWLFETLFLLIFPPVALVGIVCLVMYICDEFDHKPGAALIQGLGLFLGIPLALFLFFRFAVPPIIDVVWTISNDLRY